MGKFVTRRDQTRFDIRLAKEQKEYFEYAAELGGFRTLTEFVIFSGQQQANAIVEKHKTILTSPEDARIFFEGILNPKEPNEYLKKSAAWYKKLTRKKPKRR